MYSVKWRLAALLALRKELHNFYDMKECAHVSSTSHGHMFRFLLAPSMMDERNLKYKISSKDQEMLSQLCSYVRKKRACSRSCF